MKLKIICLVIACELSCCSFFSALPAVAQSYSLRLPAIADTYSLRGRVPKAAGREKTLPVSKIAKAVFKFALWSADCQIQSAQLRVLLKTPSSAALRARAISTGWGEKDTALRFKVRSGARRGKALAANANEVAFDVSEETKKGLAGAFEISASASKLSLIFSRESRKGATLNISCAAPLPTATNSPVSTGTGTPPATATAEQTPAGTATVTPTSPPTVSATATRTATPTRTATLTATSTPTRTVTPTATPTPTLGLAYGPYLQKLGASSLTLRWRTNIASDTELRYGPAVDDRSMRYFNATSTTDHKIALASLTPAARYYYSIGNSERTLDGGTTDFFFEMNPVAGSAAPARIWVVGDSGTGAEMPAQVRDAYLAYNGSNQTNLMLALGDNAYQAGASTTYDRVLFNMFAPLLRHTPLWPTFGNHDGDYANSSDLSGPYYDLLSLPRNAEAGGLASGTEAYYSFDYGEAHFVSLDTAESSMAVDGAMLTWLANDLAATSARWIIAFFHHPPYTKGGFDSDVNSKLTEVRTNVLPILEHGGVDLVLSGHSHVYERSYFIKGHYGLSSDFAAAPAAYTVDGGDGRVDGTGAYTKAVGSEDSGTVYIVMGTTALLASSLGTHPAMYHRERTNGSLVIDINGPQLDVAFLSKDAEVRDYFSIRKE